MSLSHHSSPELQRQLRGKESEPCPVCGEPNPAALTKHGVCYACHLAASGKPDVEAHHPIGRKNGPETITVPANLHRALSEGQAVWPAALRTNPEHDPLVTIAQIVRAVADWAVWLAVRCERISDWLLALALWLRDRLGPHWWTEVAPLW